MHVWEAYFSSQLVWWMQLLHDFESGLDMDAISAVRLFSRSHKSCFQMLSELNTALNKIGWKGMSSSYVHVPLCYHCCTSDIFSKSEFDWPLNNQVTFSQMFLKGPARSHLQLFTTTMAFSQSQVAISDILLILDLHLHVLTYTVELLFVQF